MKRGLVLRAALTGVTAILGGSLLQAPSARADIVQDLTVGNDVLSGFPTPFGTVTVHFIDSNDASVTFQANLIGTTQYSFVDGGAAALNTNGAVTASGFTFTKLFATGTPSFSQSGAGNEDGFGSFNTRVSNNGAFGDAVTTLSFNIHLVSGSWANEAAILVGNSQNLTVAAHIAVCGQDIANACVSGNENIITGFSTTPGPALGAGLPGVIAACCGLLGLARRRRQRIA